MDSLTAHRSSLALFCPIQYELRTNDAACYLETAKSWEFFASGLSSELHTLIIDIIKDGLQVITFRKAFD
eukprot:scaffold308926_cov43-Attheya_sp.AAC.1